MQMQGVIHDGQISFVCTKLSRIRFRFLSWL